MMYRQSPMLEIGLTMSLLTLYHTKKVYPFPLNKYTRSILELEIQHTNIAESFLRGDQWISIKLHPCKQMLQFNFTLTY